MNMKRASGFTLLEIIIVIIIIGVLATLALPKMFATVEFSRSAEALQNFTAIRSLFERCILLKTTAASCDTLTKIGFEAPTAATAHFTYTMLTANPTVGVQTFAILATRTTFNNSGAGGDVITYTFNDGVVTRGGSGKFSSLAN